jgi:hypothetical protein
MRAAITPFPQYASMAWCSIKAQGQLYLLPNTKLRIVYILAGSVKIVKSLRRCDGRIANIRRQEIHTEFWWGKCL